MTLKDTPIIQRYGDGQVVVSEGVISNNAYIIFSGKVKVTKKVGKKNVLIGTLTEGDVFGEMGLISKTSRSADVTAVGDVTIGIIDKARFDQLMLTVPDDLRRILEALVERLRATTQKLSRIGVELENARNTVNAFSLKKRR